MSDLTGPLRGSGTPLEKAVLGALDNLEHALQLESQGDNRFRATNEPSRFGRVFGGQLLAQAMQAATATVSDHLPQSLHAYFVRSGDSHTPLNIDVERVRDGRSIATRQVTVVQAGRTLLTAIASFHTNPAEPDLRPTATARTAARGTTAVAALGGVHPAGDAPERRDLDRCPTSAGNADRGSTHLPGWCAGNGGALPLDAPTARDR